MKKTATEKVAAFMLYQGMPIHPTPGIPDHQIVKERLSVMMEEMGELAKALNAGELILTADAIGDVLFTVMGTALSCGIPPEKVLDIVCDSNLTKTPLNEHRKGGKGFGYVPPTLRLEQLLITEEDLWDEGEDS